MQLRSLKIVYKILEPAGKNDLYSLTNFQHLSGILGRNGFRRHQQGVTQALDVVLDTN